MISTRIAVRLVSALQAWAVGIACAIITGLPDAAAPTLPHEVE
jgi:hypothetical protein